MYAKIKAMRKILTLLLLVIILTPSAEALVSRRQPSYSYRTSYRNNPTRFTRSKWRKTTSRSKYRYINTFKRTDYQRWRDMPRSTPSSENTAQEKGYGSFCHFKNTIIGEYLPTTEVTNRCCLCYDGWKCQIPTTARSNKAHECDPTWASDNGYTDSE